VAAVQAAPEMVASGVHGPGLPHSDEGRGTRGTMFE